jgi:hypothetical protein
LRCFTFHAERLHLDRVWERTRSIVEALESKGGRATLFVHPMEAIGRGFDLSERIGWLLARGHEVAQHTHFYQPQPEASTTKPVTSLAPENVRAVLDRDLDYLRSAGAEPKGFVAGGWAISPEAARWLKENGFSYDCSWRAFDLRYTSADAASGGGVTHPELVDGIVRLPTTQTLRSATFGALRRGTGPAGDHSFDVMYTHDYDLVGSVRFLAASFVIARSSRRRGRWVKALELSETFR